MERWQIVAIAFLVVLSGFITCDSSSAERARPILIGALTVSWGPTPAMVGLRDGLRQLGYREDDDFFLGVRFTQGKLAELPVAAQELVQQRVNLIVTSGVYATQAAQRATQNIPIVFTNVDDPVAFGLVKSYALPGGNLTGVTDLAMQLGPKRLELFREMMPSLRRVLFPYDGTDAAAVKELQLYREAAHLLGIELVEQAIRTQTEAQEFLIRSPDKMVQGILSPRDANLNIPGFVLQATSERMIAAIFTQPFFVERGGLASYGPNNYESGRLAARLVDKILKGQPPSKIPVEVNNNIKFSINLKVAQKLGLTIPPEVLYQADQIIR